MDSWRAITMARGLTDWADRKNVRVLYGEGASQKHRTFNLNKIESGKAEGFARNGDGKTVKSAALTEEQQRILGSLQQQGLNREAEEFLAHELNNPATIDELARGVRDEAEAIQLYTAARVAIDPDTRGEQEFLLLVFKLF